MHIKSVCIDLFWSNIAERDVAIKKIKTWKAQNNYVDGHENRLWTRRAKISSRENKTLTKLGLKWNQWVRRQAVVTWSELGYSLICLYADVKLQCWSCTPRPSLGLETSAAESLGEMVFSYLNRIDVSTTASRRKPVVGFVPTEHRSITLKGWHSTFQLIH